jgi:hypothetical protein
MVVTRMLILVEPARGVQGNNASNASNNSSPMIRLPLIFAFKMVSRILGEDDIASWQG